jgi:exopolysaccharide biosynthesis polyprenyl glycosylphosphotransferase
LPARRAFSLRYSERKLLLAFVDVVLINIALFLSPSIQRIPEGRVAPTPITYAQWSVVLTALWFILAVMFEVYDLRRSARPIQSTWMAGWAALLTMAIYLLIPWFTPWIPRRRLYLFVPMLVAPVLVIIWRFLYARILAQPAFGQRVLIVGAGWSGRTLAEAIKGELNLAGESASSFGYEVLGFVDDDEGKQGQTIANAPVLGTGHDLVTLAQRLVPDEIVVAITNSQLIRPDLFGGLLTCQEMGIPLSTMASMYEALTGRVPVEHAGRDLHVVLPVNRPAGHRIYLGARRVVDILVSLIAAILLVLLTPMVWIGNRLTAPGDLFYRQERLGRAGERFHLIKFRSMVMNAEEESGPVWAGEYDARVTPVGRFLRRTRLDELPQCWNVLRGEMSLIGPRPERPAFVDALAAEIPFYRVRHAVKPGITGWAQVNYGYGASVADALVKLQYDLYYIKNQSAYLDFQILVRTVQVMLGLKGR